MSIRRTNIAPINNASRIGSNAPPTVVRQGVPAATSIFPRTIPKPGRLVVQKPPIITKPAITQPLNNPSSSNISNATSNNNNNNNIRNAMNNMNNTNKASFLIRKSNTLAKQNGNNNNNNPNSNLTNSTISNPSAVSTTANKNQIQGIPSRPTINKQISSNESNIIPNNMQQSTISNNQIQPSSQSTIPSLSHQDSIATTTASVTQSISSIPIPRNPSSPQQQSSQVFTSPLVQNRKLIAPQQPSLVSQPSISNQIQNTQTIIQPVQSLQSQVQQPAAVDLPVSNIFQSSGPSSITLQRNRNMIGNSVIASQQANSGDSSNPFRLETTSIRQPSTIIQQRPDTPIPSLAASIQDNNNSNNINPPSSVANIEDNLASLNRLRREREAVAARRQQFDERMSQASRVVRRQMRNEYRNRNGRDMSGSSSGEEEEEQKENFSQRQQQRQPIRGRALSDGSEEEEEEEMKENDIQLRRNNHNNNEPANNSRRTVAQSLPPVRNIENNIHQLQFRRPQMPPNPQYQAQIQPSISQSIQEPVSEDESEYTPPRNRMSNPDRRITQDNNRNPINSDQPQPPSLGSGIRLMIPLMQLANLNGNSGNPRQIAGITLGQLMELFSSRLNSLQGPITGQTLQEISQIAATMRLLQGAFSQSIPRGLSTSQIKDFPVVKLKSIDKDEICSVCLEDWKINDEAKLLGCMHKFHSHCIDSWLKSSTICPNCKQNQLEFFEDKIPESLQQK